MLWAAKKKKDWKNGLIFKSWNGVTRELSNLNKSKKLKKGQKILLKFIYMDEEIDKTTLRPKKQKTKKGFKIPIDEKQRPYMKLPAKKKIEEN